MAGTTIEQPAASLVPLGTFYFDTTLLTLFVCALVGGVHVWEQALSNSSPLVSGLIHADGSVSWTADQSLAGFRFTSIGGLSGVAGQLNY
jgi:hypothetical protein